MYNVNVDECDKQIVNCFKKQIHKIMIPPFPLLKPAPTDLYTEISERIPNKILQIIRISWISQYTVVKSEKILKKSKDLQGFHRYILKYPQTMNHTMYIPVTYYKMTHQRCKLTSINDINGPNKIDHCCPLK